MIKTVFLMLGKVAGKVTKNTGCALITGTRGDATRRSTLEQRANCKVINLKPSAFGTETRTNRASTDIHVQENNG